MPSTRHRDLLPSRRAGQDPENNRCPAESQSSQLAYQNNFDPKMRGTEVPRSTSRTDQYGSSAINLSQVEDESDSIPFFVEPAAIDVGELNLWPNKPMIDWLGKFDLGRSTMALHGCAPTQPLMRGVHLAPAELHAATAGR